MKRILFGAFGLAALCWAAAAAQTLPAQPPAAASAVPARPASPVNCAAIDFSKPMTADQLQDAHLCQEISKLQQEIVSLRNANVIPFSATLTPWSSLLTGLAALTGAVVGVILQQSLARSQNRRLDQERTLQREQHNLKLMENLGSPNRAVQLAAVSALLGRIEDIYAEKREGVEAKTISDVVMSGLRDRDIHPAVAKYLADQVVRTFRLAPGKAAPEEGPRISLQEFNLQGARLASAYWAGVDARGVDFYGADFTGASLRNADLRGAVFYDANLTGTVLRGARLAGANFSGAVLEGANLIEAAGLDTALFDARTRWNAATKWPDGFTPPAFA